MFIKSKVLAAAAAMALVGGVGAVGVFTVGMAGAATPACGEGCPDFFSYTFGDYAQPNFLLDVLRQGEKVGQPIILFRTSNTDPAEDFTIADEGSVSDFSAAGLVSKALDLHYGGAGCEDYDTATATCITFYPDDQAYELEYSPFGVDSGLCVGTAATAVNGTEVSLQPCGATAKTTWILDAADAIGITPPPPPTVPPPPLPTLPPVPIPTLSLPTLPVPSLTDTDSAVTHGRTAVKPAEEEEPFFPLINGSGTNFSHPYVLSYPQNSFPTDTPRPQLKTQTLQIDSSGVVNTNQMWGVDGGVAP
jgi:hypothetical protein